MTEKKTDTENDDGELQEGDLEKVDGGSMVNLLGKHMGQKGKTKPAAGAAALDSPLLDTPHIFDRTHRNGKG